MEDVRLLSSTSRFRKLKDLSNACESFGATVEPPETVWNRFEVFLTFFDIFDIFDIF
jgi:hypothetical protein